MNELTGKPRDPRPARSNNRHTIARGDLRERASARPSKRVGRSATEMAKDAVEGVALARATFVFAGGNGGGSSGRRPPGARKKTRRRRRGGWRQGGEGLRRCGEASSVGRGGAGNSGRPLY